MCDDVRELFPPIVLGASTDSAYGRTGRGDRETRGRALRGTFSASPWVEDDGGDRWRTAALQIRYKDYQVGFSIYTGERNTEKVKTINGEPTYTNDIYK